MPLQNQEIAAGLTVEDYARELAAAMRALPTVRDRFMTKGVSKTLVDPEGTDLEIYTYETDISGVSAAPIAIAFQGKATKPLWHVRFRDESSRKRYIEEAIKTRQAQIKGKQEKKELRQQHRQEWSHGFQVGDILYSSWGYDQTQADFFAVSRVLGKVVEIRELASKIVKEEQGADYVVAVPQKYVGPPQRKIPQPDRNQEPSIRLNSFATAHKWDGKPKYQTAVGWGH